jgi:excisionase family DNA binding protein
VRTERKPSSQRNLLAQTAIRLVLLGCLCLLRRITVPTILRPALDIYDAATLFKCSHKTIRRMIADGRLPAVKVGARWRIRPEDVAVYLAGGGAQ